MCLNSSTACLNLSTACNNDAQSSVIRDKSGLNTEDDFPVTSIDNATPEILHQVGLTDITPWAVDLSFADLDSSGFKGVLSGLFGGGKKEGDGSYAGPAAGEVFKEVPLYGANTPLPLKKTLSITRSEDFEVRFQDLSRIELVSRNMRNVF